MADVAVRPQLAERIAPAGGRRGWGLTHYLALVGAILLVVQAYVYVAWLSDSPHQITKFRDRQDISWTMARVFEVAVFLGFIACLVYVVRKSRREGRLTFDAKLVIAGFTVIWLDEWTNLVAPIWAYSTQWLNLNNPTAYLPGVINPDMKRLPFPMFHLFNYPVALLGAGIVVSALMRLIRRRWPGLSTAQLVLLVAGAGMCFDLVYEMPMFALRLWSFPGSPSWLALFRGSAMKFPIFEIIPAGMAFATFGALRFFKNDRGQEITERGLDHLPARRRSVVSILALAGVVQLVWLACTTVQVFGGFYAAPYNRLPPHLVNDMCDAPLAGGGQLVGTRYGPCPQEGHAYPIRKIEGSSQPRPCVVGRPPDAAPVPWPACDPPPSHG